MPWPSTRPRTFHILGEGADHLEAHEVEDDDGQVAESCLITLFANMASWSFGVNAVAEYAAKNQNRFASTLRSLMKAGNIGM